MNIRLFDIFKKSKSVSVLSTVVQDDRELCEVMAELDKILTRAYEHDEDEVTLPVDLVMSCRQVLSKFDRKEP